MHALLLVVTLLANQPAGAPAKFMETKAYGGLADAADCQRLAAYAVSETVRSYAEKGQFVSVQFSCVGH